MSRQRIMSTPMFEHESYRCSECRTDLEHTEVTDDWKCAHCGNRAIIDTPNLENEIMRKLPSEVTNKDMLLKQGQFYEIYSTASKKNGNFQYNLKGFGAYEQNEYTFVNVLVTYD